MAEQRVASKGRFYLTFPSALSAEQQGTHSSPALLSVGLTECLAGMVRSPLVEEVSVRPSSAGGSAPAGSVDIVLDVAMDVLGGAVDDAWRLSLVGGLLMELKRRVKVSYPEYFAPLADDAWTLAALGAHAVRSTVDLRGLCFVGTRQLHDDGMGTVAKALRLVNFEQADKGVRLVLCMLSSGNPLWHAFLPTNVEAIADGGS